MTAIERDRQIHRAFVVINALLENPSTGRKLNNATKKKLFLFFYYLSEIQQKDNYSYFADKYNKVIQVRKGDIRKSWSMIAEHMSRKFEREICARTCVRLAGILAELDLLSIEHEELATAKVYHGMQSLKVIRLKTWSELEEFEAEMAVEDLIRNVNRIIMEHTEPEKALEYAEIESQERAYAFPDTSENVFVPQSDSYNVLYHKESVLDGQKLITPAESENWRVEVAEGRVSADRRLLPRDEVPEEYDGEYYAAWVGEKADMFYTPWVIWDVDGEPEQVEQTLQLTRDFVTNLLDYVPEEAVRIVFSTRKGFHVYLDSRTIGLKPSKDLHAQIRQFCKTLLPECDESLYSRRHVIGVPNSRHKTTGLRYCPLTVEEFFDLSIAEMRVAARQPQEFEERSEEMHEVPHLSKIFHEKKSSERKGFSGLDTIRNSLMQGHPAFRGVSKGNRDRAMYELAYHYKRLGLSIEEAFVLVCAANDRNTPTPLPRDTIRKKVNSAFSREGVTIA